MYDELKKLYDSDIYPMHMPGHKRQEGFGQIKNALEIDITEIPGYDDLYEPEGFIKDALKRAAELYKAEHTVFLVNGSTVGILASVFAATKPHGRILIARNCHKSVYHAAALRELNAEYIFPSQTDGMFESIDPKEVEDKIKSADFDAVIITSPTYEGRVSDIEKIAHICHEHKTALIVDEAHGAHFGFHERFPKSAVGAADIVIMSTHKTLPTLTQTGLLHVNDEYYEKVINYLQMFQTSSPSYLLMSSIDSCLSKIRESGSKLWEDFFTYRDAFTKRMDKLQHLRYIETDDPCKIVISTAESSIYATRLAEMLLNEYHIQIEMESAEYIVAIVTCNDSKEGFERFADALLKIDSTLFDSKDERISSQRLAGLLHTKAQNNIYIYPPGIPIAVTGEVIDESIIDTLNKYEAAGLRIRGL